MKVGRVTIPLSAAAKASLDSDGEGGLATSGTGAFARTRQTLRLMERVAACVRMEEEGMEERLEEEGMEEEHLSDEGSSLDEIWSSLDNELHPRLAKVHVQMRRWIAEVLPAAVELTRADLMARKGLGLSLAPLVGGVLAAAATACGSHSAGAAVTGTAATSEPPERAVAVDPVPIVLPVPTVDSVPTGLPVPSVDSVPTVLRATTLVCRVLRNSCASQPAVQLALASNGTLMGITRLLMASSALPLAMLHAQHSAPGLDECARAAAQLAANIAVGQAETQAALWRDGQLLGTLLGSDRHDLVSIGVMLLFNCSRNHGRRLRQLVFGRGQLDRAVLGGSRAAGKAMDDVWGGPQPYWLSAALYVVQAEAQSGASGRGGRGGGSGGGSRGGSSSGGIGGGSSGGSSGSGGGGGSCSVGAHHGAYPGMGADVSWSLLLVRELITSGLLLDAFACAYELDGFPSAADELADEVTEIGRDRNEIGRDRDEIAQPAAEVPEEAAHGGTEATEGARAPGTTRVAKTAPAAWAHTATLNHVATLCDAVEAACDDKGETCGMMGGPWRRALACRLTRLLHQAGRKAWWLHAPDAPCSTTPPARCCELVCLLRVAGDLAMQKEAPFGPPAVEIGDVAAFRAPSEGTEAAGDAADDATSPAPDPTIDVLEPLLRALAQMAVWQPPMMSPSKSSAAKAAAALAVPTHSMEQEAIRLIAFMAHGSVAVRDRVRELGGLFTVLQRCQLDEANPNIKEWAVFAIRNLTENSQANREFLAQIERAPCSVANPGVLEQADLEVAVNRQTGKLEVVRKTTTAETGTIV